MIFAAWSTADLMSVAKVANLRNGGEILGMMAKAHWKSIQNITDAILFPGANYVLSFEVMIRTVSQ